MVKNNKANTFIYRLIVGNLREYPDLIKEDFGNFSIELHTDARLLVVKSDDVHFDFEKIQEYLKFNHKGLQLRVGEFLPNRQGMWKLINDMDSYEEILLVEPHGKTENIDNIVKEENLNKSDLREMNYPIDFADFTIEFEEGKADILFDLSKFIVYAENDKVRNQLIHKMKEYKI